MANCLAAGRRSSKRKTSGFERSGCARSWDMSTDTWGVAFGELEEPARNYRLLRHMLRELTEPKAAFEPPPPCVDLSLGEPQGAPIAEVLSEVRTKVVAH